MIHIQKNYSDELARSMTPYIIKKVRDDLRGEGVRARKENILDIAAGFIPVLGILKAKTSFSSYRDYRFGCKILEFLESFSRTDYNQDQLDKTVEEIEGLNQESFFETMMDTLERIDNVHKSTILSNILRYTVNGLISKDNYLRHCWILTNVPYIDLQQLHNYTSDYYQPSSSEILAANGLLNETIIGNGTYGSEEQNQDAGSKFGLSPIGEEMLHYGLLDKDWRYTGSGKQISQLQWKKL